ncbi:MAG: hypothetical protein LBD75_08165 [Candidatus Peribacteria bacterium]|nr:hypothetical protein [Candidatus Peribacteria bacterium]
MRQDETSQAISFYANKSLSGVLMVSGTVSIGSTNTGNVTSFVGGGSENVANGENTLIL